MKKLFIAFLTIAAFSFQAQAKSGSTQCVPSMSVEEAQAQFTAGMNSASEKLSQDYQNAVMEHAHANEAALARYNEKVADAEATYAAEVREIRAHYALGWQEALNAATAKHNQTVQDAGDNYAAETQGNEANYLQETEMAKANYDATEKALTAQYDAAVCAR